MPIVLCWPGQPAPTGPAGLTRRRAASKSESAGACSCARGVIHCQGFRVIRVGVSGRGGHCGMDAESRL
jgi:hypothetical protein